MTHQETQMFEDQPALIHCLPQLNNLRVAGKLADLTIELQNNVKVNAHRVVFASRMPSLCNALCKPPRTGQDFMLKWPQISPEVATSFIDYIYTGQLEVHEANAAGLTVLSQQLVLPQVEEWAVSFMATRLDSENIVNKWQLAELLKSDMLKTACLQHIKATFEDTVPTDFFIQLPSEAVLSLLRADDLQAESEESVLNAIQRWVSPLGEVDETRLVHAEAMMREVRWGQVDGDFRCQLQDDDEGFWNKNLGCAWYELPNLRQARGSAAAVALPDGRVFVMGGYGSQNNSWCTLSSVETCHLREPADWQGPRKASNVFWKDAAAMLYSRSGHDAVVFRGRIFVGGRQGSRTVDIFTPPDNKRPLGQWTHLTNSDTKSPTTALAVCQERLFSFGKSSVLHPATG
ncbi:unnamed protein product [Dibothriocephalus latus]|uniref:BTB domain-containing protein n=1 Tax=Dibothriocephalus latus TaxID=60516 RepID=A0A3P7NSM9_DIBLA|nr:unnamed protein product [Dibothriocephalus latus]